MKNRLIKNIIVSKITLEYKATCKKSQEDSFAPGGKIIIEHDNGSWEMGIDYDDSKIITRDLTYLKDKPIKSINFNVGKSMLAAESNIYTFNLSDIKLTYTYFGPVTTGVSDASIGSVNLAVDNYDTGTITVTANPIEGYHFTQWSDGNTINPRTMIISGSKDFTAIIEPNTYTLNFFDSTSGSDVLYDTITCTYDDVEKLAPSLPERTAPDGYVFNPIGWCPSKTGRIREGTTIIKDVDGNELP